MWGTVGMITVSIGQKTYAQSWNVLCLLQLAPVSPKWYCTTVACSNLDVAELRRLDDAEDESPVVGVVVGGGDVGRRQHDGARLVHLGPAPSLSQRHRPLVVHQRHAHGHRRRRRPLAVRHAQAERVLSLLRAVVDVPAAIGRCSSWHNLSTSQ